MQKKKYICKHFMEALVTITKTCKQPKYPSTTEWVNKLWYIHKMEYFSAIKKDRKIHKHE